MRTLAVLLAVPFLLAAVPPKSTAQILSHTITAFTSPPDVLFNPSLGTLTSVGLEFKFHAGVTYDALDGLSGTMPPFDVVFSGDTPLVVTTTAGQRTSTFSWTLPGHCDGGRESFYVALSTGSFSSTYTDPTILDFFTFHGGDESFIAPVSAYINVSPEVISDSGGARYDAYFANVELGDGIVITYSYELAPVPEPGTVLLLVPALTLFLVPRRR